MEVLAGCLGDRVFLANFVDDGFGLGLGLPDIDTRLEPRDNAPLHVVAVGNVIRNARGNPHTRKLFHIRLRRKQQFETWCQHAHNGRWWSKGGSDWKRFANHRSIAAKALLEIFITQDNHRWQRRWCISGRSIAGGCCRSGWLRRTIRLLKVSARDERTTHHLKEIGRHRSHAHSLGPAIQSRKSGAKRIDGSEILEIVFRSVAQVKKVGVRKRKIFDVASLQVAANQHQALWILVRKFPQQHAISDTKDGRAGTDSQGDGDHDCDCEYWTFAQRAQRVGEIV